MKAADVYYNGSLAGELIQHANNSYEFRYLDSWFTNDALPAISLTLPKLAQIYKSDHLFPFFFSLLSEGYNRKLQCRLLKIDEKDYFGLLLATASADTIGPVTVVKKLHNQ